MVDLTDKIALVTGAARGIGASIALKLASVGCDVMISDIDVGGAQKTALQIIEMGRNAKFVKTDVSQMSDAENMIKTTLDQFGRIDILVNNAGITRDNLLMRMNENEWDAVIAINLKGTFNCIKAATRSMLKQIGRASCRERV